MYCKATQAWYLRGKTSLMDGKKYKYWYDAPVVHEVRKNIQEALAGMPLGDTLEFPVDILDEFEEAMPPELRRCSPEGHLYFMGVKLVPEGEID